MTQTTPEEAARDFRSAFLDTLPKGLDLIGFIVQPDPETGNYTAVVVSTLDPDSIAPVLMDWLARYVNVLADQPPMTRQ